MAPPPVQKNPDLPTSYQRPGVYVYQSRVGAAPVADNRRVLFFAYKTSAGSMQSNVATRIQNEEEAVSFAGKGSDLVRQYRAYGSHVKAGSETYFLAVTTPSGTAQTRLLKVMAAPSGAALGSNSTAQAACVLDVWIEGYRASVIVANGDTFATIASNLNAEILKIEDYLSCTTGVGTDTVTLTGRHAAETSTDIPIIVRVSNTAAAIAVSCGTLTLANASDADTAQSTGHTLLCTTQTAQYAPGNAESANTAAAGFITALNATNAYPLTAAQTAPSAVMTLFHVNDRVVNRMSATTLDASQTTTLAAGTAGAGAPTLTTALAHLESQPTFKLILPNFIDTTTLGTLSTHVEQQGNGRIQKGQVTILCDTRRLATAGAVPTGTTPALTLSPRYVLGWCPASPQQAYELAARVAAEIINRIEYPPYNYAGTALTTNGQVPLLLPHEAVKPSDSDINSAMVSYYMMPLVPTTDNQLIIESGRTTAKPTAILDGDYRWVGTILTDDFVRDDLVASLPGVIRGKSLKAYGEPRTQYAVSTEGIQTAAFARMLYYDSLDIFDESAQLREALRVEVNSAHPARVDVELPKRFLIPCEQISVTTTKRS